jgi:hypothetical protein
LNERNRGISLSPKSRKTHTPPWLTQVADHLVPNQVLGFFEFFREREGKEFLFSKACKSLYRRRFKEIEDAPFAAYACIHNVRRDELVLKFITLLSHQPLQLFDERSKIFSAEICKIPCNALPAKITTFQGDRG